MPITDLPTHPFHCQAWEDTANGLAYSEGFQLIQFLDQDPEIETNRLTRPALLIDAQSMWNFSATGDVAFGASIVPGVLNSVTEWISLNSDSVVIVLIDDNTVLPSRIAAEADSPDIQSMLISGCHQQMFHNLTELCCPFPIYYYHVQFGAFDEQSFHRVSSPGPISWLLRRHHINLSQSLWIAPCPKNTPYSVPFGISYLPAAEFFAGDGWDMPSKIRRYSMSSHSLPDWLLPSAIVPTNQPNSSITEATNFPKVQPLEAERRSQLENNPTLSNSWILTSEEISFGRVHGCAFPPHNLVDKKRRATDEIPSPSPLKRVATAGHFENAIVIRDSSSIPTSSEPEPVRGASDGVILIDSQDEK